MFQKPGFGTFCSSSERITKQRENTILNGSPADRYCNETNLDSEWTEFVGLSNYTALYITDTNFSDCVCTTGDFSNPLQNCGTYENDPIYGNSRIFAGGEPLKKKFEYSGMLVPDLKGRNVADWLTKSVDKDTFTFRRYGGFSLGLTI